ncbi:hypothetical protein MKW94_025061, partial [Papaver nudicaule]|nr:hypothetical protein [Papaver nudicaule]
DLNHAIFKLVWNRRSIERERNEGTNNLELFFSFSGIGGATATRTQWSMQLRYVFLI